MKRVAFILRGSVALKNGALRGLVPDNNQYVNFKACACSTFEHVMKANPNYTFDIFIHCWNVDLQDELVELYKPVAFQFEDNKQYHDQLAPLGGDIRQTSQALTMKKGIELVENYVEQTQQSPYDMVILYRPDMLLWKDMKLDMYDLKENIYVCALPDQQGDYHFVMNPANASLFKNLIHSGYTPLMHSWIKLFVTQTLCKPLVMDDIVPAQHHEIVRKLQPLIQANIGIDLDKYGLTLEDIQSYIYV